MPGSAPKSPNPDDRLVQIGRRITKARLEAGYRSARKFAELLGVSEATAQRWERGANEPSISSLELVSQITGRSIDWLQTGVEARGPKYDDALQRYLETPQGKLASPTTRRRLAQLDVRGLTTSVTFWRLVHTAIESAATDDEAARAASFTADLLEHDADGSRAD